MKSKEEIINELNNNDELLQKLEQAWRNNASYEEITELISEAGTDLTLDDIQDILAIRKKHVLEALKYMPLDDDQLENVAGGGNGLCEGSANCDMCFRKHADIIPSNERCKFNYLCDEFYMNMCLKHYANLYLIEPTIY